MESLTARILAKASGRTRVEPGECVTAKIDKIMIHDVTGPIAVNVIEEVGVEKLSNPDGIFIILDHYSPPPNTVAANIHRKLRDFAKKFGIKNIIDICVGICHQVMVEGIIRPGDVVIGADSHTTTGGALAAFATGVGSTEAAYAMITGELWFKVPEPLFIEFEGRLPAYASGKDVILYILSLIGADGATYRAMEFAGSGLKSLGMSDRLCIANMAVEGGAKNAIFPLDDITINYFKELGIELDLTKLSYLKPIDINSPELTIDLASIEPMVSKPPNPANAVPVGDVEGTKIDMAFIGSCTGGRYEDLLIAAKILKNRRVSPDVRLIIIPASMNVYRKALENGLVKIFIDAGAILCPPSCGPCFGGHLGVTGDDEVVISSSNRNFKGRMGSPKARIYLASPATVAASAIEGFITDPRPYLR